MIGLGVLGCGDVAFRTYLPGLAPLAGRAEVVACFDPIPERAARFAAEAARRGSPRAEAFSDRAAFLAHPALDAVVNLSPAPLHFEQNRAALEAGKHVFSEKPLAATVAEARALIDLARSADRLLLVAPATMATSRFRWLRREFETGRFGRLILATGQYANMGPAAWSDYKGDPAVFYRRDVGPLLDTGVYLLHAMTGLLGPARRVEAFGGVAIPRRRVLIPSRLGETIEVEADDQLLLHLDFGDNRFAQLLSSFATPRSKVPALELHGTGGSVSIPLEVWYDIDAPIDTFRRDERLGPPGNWRREAAPERNPVEGLIQSGPAHFVACLEGAEAPILTAEHATHVLDLILTAQRSVREGRALEPETAF